MKTKIDQLLEGAIDLHCHCYPEFNSDFKSRLDDQEMLETAQRAGMLGIVLKSHIWPTVGRVDYLRRLVPGFQTFSSITLNITSGGISPWAVELAALQGAKVVWMPTWSSVSSIKKGGIGNIIKKWVPSLESVSLAEGLGILDESGHVLNKVIQILEIAKKYAVIVSTGHLYPEESLKLAEESEKIGFKKLVFGHPLAGSVKASMEVIRQMANLNCLIELNALNTFFHGSNLKQAAEVIQAVGADRCLLTSDFFGSWVPPSSEMLRMFIGGLLESGIEEDAIRQMIKINPAKLLDISSQ